MPITNKTKSRPNTSVSLNERFYLDAIKILRDNYHRLSLEEEEMIKNLAKKLWK